MVIQGSKSRMKKKLFWGILLVTAVIVVLLGRLAVIMLFESELRAESKRASREGTPG